MPMLPPGVTGGDGFAKFDMLHMKIDGWKCSLDGLSHLQHSPGPAET